MSDARWHELSLDKGKHTEEQYRSVVDALYIANYRVSTFDHEDRWVIRTDAPRARLAPEWVEADAPKYPY